LGLLVTRHVHRGQVTTLEALSEALYGHKRSSRGVGTMMKAWAAHDARGCVHRVLNDDGSVLGDASQRERLEKEGITFDKDGRADLDQHQAQLPPYAKSVA
jgi:alkylated DNA nucleotide flippase Atl1